MTLQPKSTDGFGAALARFLRRLWGKETPGARGERLSAEWLVREKGFSIIARNWRNPRDRRDEIDLVCRDGDVLVFVEVKTRAAGALVPGYYAVDAHKKEVLRRAVAAYLHGLDARAKLISWRCDIVEVSLPKEGSSTSGLEILHFENIALGLGRGRSRR